MITILQLLQEISIDELAQSDLTLAQISQRLSSQQITCDRFAMKLLNSLPDKIQCLICALQQQEKNIIHQIKEKFKIRGKSLCDVGIDEVMTEFYNLMPADLAILNYENSAKVYQLHEFFKKYFSTDLVNQQIISPLHKLYNVIHAKRIELLGVMEKIQDIDRNTEHNIIQLRNEYGYAQKEEKRQAIVKELVKRRDPLATGIQFDPAFALLSAEQLVQARDTINTDLSMIDKKINIDQIYLNGDNLKRQKELEELAVEVCAQTNLKNKIAHTRGKIAEELLEQIYIACKHYRDALENELIKKIEKKNVELATMALCCAPVLYGRKMIAGPRGIEFLSDRFGVNEMKTAIELTLHSSTDQLLIKKYQLMSSFIEDFPQHHRSYEAPVCALPAVERLNRFYDRFFEAKQVIEKSCDSFAMRFIKKILALITFGRSTDWFKPEGKKFSEEINRITFWNKNNLVQPSVAGMKRLTLNPRL